MTGINPPHRSPQREPQKKAPESLGTTPEPTLRSGQQEPERGGERLLAKRFFKTKDEVEVTFEVDRPDLDSVDLCADAFGWEPIALKRADRGKGPFRVKVRLPKDNPVQFRYIFNRVTWENDEAADAYWPNDRGGDNSVVLTYAA